MVKLPIVKLTEQEVKHPNFVSDDKIYLVRCTLCHIENYAFSVAVGQCAWCGAKHILIKKEK